MGFLKRIFGSGSKEDTKRLEDTVTKINSGEINKIYPILKPGDWVGAKYGAVKRVLVGPDENPELYVGFGYDSEDNFVFVTEDMLGERTEEDIINEALKNLSEFSVDINEVAPGEAIVSDGFDFCCEKILDEDFMMEVHKRLNSEEVHVSIPRRRNLMAVSKTASEPIYKKFLDVHFGTWEDDSYGNAPVYPWVFVVKNAKISGIIRFETEG